MKLFDDAVMIEEEIRDVKWRQGQSVLAFQCQLYQREVFKNVGISLLYFCTRFPANFGNPANIPN
jgi:hypothetical protein